VRTLPDTPNPTESLGFGVSRMSSLSPALKETQGADISQWPGWPHPFFIHHWPAGGRDIGPLVSSALPVPCVTFTVSSKTSLFVKVSNVLLALQAGSRGTQACINAASTVSGIIGDLDTTIMFATAGSLNADNDELFGDHR